MLTTLRRSLNELLNALGLFLLKLDTYKRTTGIYMLIIGTIGMLFLYMVEYEPKYNPSQFSTEVLIASWALANFMSFSAVVKIFMVTKLNNPPIAELVSIISFIIVLIALYLAPAMTRGAPDSTEQFRNLIITFWLISWLWLDVLNVLIYIAKCKLNRLDTVKKIHTFIHN
ncbi:TPA: hypothetical protein DF272_06440 [Candidatus Falkowbacteria bacterium]|nr:hypothetical protein [Candidatus Falkowbacteria bacterium]